MVLTKQEELFFDRVALTMSAHPEFTIEQAARHVCDRDIAIVNRYCRMTDLEQDQVKRDFLHMVYTECRKKAGQS